jgi:hypothetical protein
MRHDYSLDDDLYTFAALQRARRDFSKLCTVGLRPENGITAVSITPLTDTPVVVDEFLNYALGLSVQEILA